MSIKLTRPLTRFDGFQNLGAFKKTKDTRTVDELKATIELWAKASSEVKEFLPQLDKMNPKHLGLVADTIELANRKALLPNDINLKSQTSAGKTLLGVLLDIFPRASLVLSFPKFLYIVPKNDCKINYFIYITNLEKIQ